MMNSTAIQSLLLSNDIPTESQAAGIEDLCAGLQSQIRTIDREICSLEGTIFSLKIKKIALEEVRNSFRAVRSRAVRTLPVDILHEIFLFCLSGIDEPPNIVGAGGPRALAEVCRRWRQIVVDSPQLWSSFSVHVSRKTRHEGALALHSWIERSKKAPLSIKVSSSIDSAEGTLDRVFALLIPHSERWKRLEIAADSPYLSGLQGAFETPLLETVVLGDGPGMHSPSSSNDPSLGWTEHLKFLERSPRLGSFTMVATHSNSPLPAVPWRQLTSLRLSSLEANFDLDTDTMLMILEDCVELRELKLCLSFCTHRPHAQHNKPMMVSLPTLVFMDIETGYPQSDSTMNVPTLLNTLHTPHLERLEVHSPILNPDLSFPVYDLLRRSLCPLKTLYLRGVRPEKGTLELVSRSLEELEIREGSSSRFSDEEEEAILDEGFLEDLTVREGEGEKVLCPHLRSIFFDYGGDLISRDTVVAFLRSRTYGLPKKGGTVAKLEDVCLKMWRDNAVLEEKDGEAQEVVNAGVDLELLDWW